MPEWTIDEYQRTFGDTLDAQLSFMSGMPDLDIRVNTLKSNLDKVELALKKFHPIRTVCSPFGMRVKSGGLEYKFPNLEKTLSYAKGQIEIQNEEVTNISDIIWCRPWNAGIGLLRGPWW